MHKIEYPVLLENIKQMVNLLEYDAMRSPGKAKLNSGHLEALLNLQDRYTKELAADKKSAPKKAATQAAE